jgi:hypothetical protein
MELGVLKQEVLRNLGASLEEVRDTKLCPLIVDIMSAVEAAESTERINEILANMTTKMEEILDTSKVVIVNEYIEMVNALTLTAEEREKLDAMFDGYAESCETAREIDPSVNLRSIKDLYRVFIDLDPEKVKEILKMQKPTLLVVPKNSFKTKINSINAHKKFPHQEDSYVNPYPDSPYRTVFSPDKIVISVVDGEPHMPHIQGIASDSAWPDRKKMFMEYLTAKGMRLINIHEIAVLMQRSLREYQQNGNDESKIVDFYLPDSDDNTDTCLGNDYFDHQIWFLPASCFCQPKKPNYLCGFQAYVDNNNGSSLRARPAVTILEY